MYMSNYQILTGMDLQFESQFHEKNIEGLFCPKNEMKISE